MKAFFNNDSGATAVEFAVVFPAFVTIVLIIIEFGQLLWIMNTINYAVEDSARCGAVDTIDCGTTTQIQALGAHRALGLVPAGDFTVTYGPVCVSANYSFPAMPLTFSFKSCHP